MLYLSSVIIYQYGHSSIAQYAALVSGLYVIAVASWFGLVRREIVTVFTGRWERFHTVFRSEAIFQFALIASLVAGLYALTFFTH